MPVAVGSAGNDSQSRVSFFSDLVDTNQKYKTFAIPLAVCARRSS